VTPVDPNQHDRFFIKQRMQPMVNQYEVSTLGPDEKSAGEEVGRIYDPAENEIGWAQERSLVVALFRRLVGLVPIVGDFSDWLPIPYHFDYYIGEQRIGGLQRILGVRDRYRLDVSGDADRTIDRRLVLALAVGMDALQAR
jgi:hypothetical protein